MVSISDLFSTFDFDREYEAGYITVRKHPDQNLFICNYSDKAQFDRHWNDVTLNCRGLIIDEWQNVIARPWKKFFNFGEGFLEIDMDMPVEITDKIDGSLGILYRDKKDNLSIATRGSFESDQARHATKLWRARYSSVEADPAFTFLFEIVYPANRVVLNYGDLDDLVLLGAVNTQYGYYLGPREAAGILDWPGPVTEVFEYKNMQDAFSNNERANAEGYVVRSGNKLVKLKQVDYMELHRIITNLSARTVWERLGNDETVEQICDKVPDEFHQFVKDVATDLFTKQEAKEYEVIYEFLRVTNDCPMENGGFVRKDFASAVSKSVNKAYLFKVLDGQPISRLIWQTLKPSGSKE